MNPNPNQTLDKSYTNTQTTFYTQHSCASTYVRHVDQVHVVHCIHPNTIFLCHLGKFQTPKCRKDHANRTSKLENVCKYHANERSKLQNATNTRKMNRRNSKTLLK